MNEEIAQAVLSLSSHPEWEVVLQYRQAELLRQLPQHPDKDLPALKGRSQEVADLLRLRDKADKFLTKASESRTR
jgi:hypothetical protein